jgi:hypothetical protein
MKANRQRLWQHIGPGTLFFFSRLWNALIHAAGNRAGWCCHAKDTLLAKA